MLSAQHTVQNFTLSNGGKSFTLNDHKTKKAVVVVFTSSHCSYSRQYEQRLATIAQKYHGQGVAFLAVNSNDASINEKDNEEYIRKAAPYPFPYLKDNDQSIAKMFKVTKNPEAFILKPGASGFDVVYQGKVDDNPLDASMVKQRFLEDALNQLLNGQPIEPATTTPSGCNIKWMQ